MAASFFEALPATLAREEWDRYADAVDEVRIDNFGSAGTRLLLGWLGVPEVSQDFFARGLGEGGVPRFGRLTAELQRGEGVVWIRTRVVSYVEYRLESARGCLQGQGTCENAYHGEVTSDSRWLRAVTPPFNPFADRRTCSEFRFFDRLIEALATKGMAGSEAVRAMVHGHIWILINAPPCVSCIGVVRQFRLLFPSVALRVSGGRPVSLASTLSACAEAEDCPAAGLTMEQRAEGPNAPPNARSDAALDVDCIFEPLLELLTAVARRVGAGS